MTKSWKRSQWVSDWLSNMDSRDASASNKFWMMPGNQANILICIVWNWICLIVDVRKCSKRNPGPSNIFLQDECTRKGSLQAIDISMDKNQVLNSEATLIDKSCDRQRLKKSSVCSFASSLDSKQVSSLVHRAERRKKISLCTIPDIVTTITSVGSVNNLAKCKMF